LDGWRIDFFLGCYEVLEDYLLSIIEEYRRIGKMLAPFISTFIALIPKKDEPSSFSEHMPIS